MSKLRTHRGKKAYLFTEMKENQGVENALELTFKEVKLTKELVWENGRKIQIQGS